MKVNSCSWRPRPPPRLPACRPPMRPGIPWGADQQETSAQMDNDLNVGAARHGYGEHRAYPQTHRHDGTWR